MLENFKRHKYIVINSKDKNTYSLSNSSFCVNFAYDIPFKYAKLLYVNIPNTFYNIHENNNSLIVGGVTSQVAEGCYSLYELIDQLLAQFPIFTQIIYNSITQKLEFTASASTSLSFPSTNSIHEVLGFGNNYNVTSTSFISQVPPNISINNIYIEIDQLKNNYMNTNNIYRNQTFVIPNNANKEDYIIYDKINFPQFVHCYNEYERIYNLNVKLMDHNGNELKNVANWTMVLIFCW